MCQGLPRGCPPRNTEPRCRSLRALGRTRPDASAGHLARLGGGGVVLQIEPTAPGTARYGGDRPTDGIYVAGDGGLPTARHRAAAWGRTLHRARPPGDVTRMGGGG